MGAPLDVLTREDVEAPTPGDGEVVLDVEAVGLTFPDVLLGQGKYQVATKLPWSPGSEVVGRLPDSGARVVAMGGALADQVALRRDHCFPVPDGMSAAAATALIVNYSTSWYALHERAHIQPGEWLLVNAGAGGVGSAAIDLGVAAGARVVATAGGQEKTEICRQVGAEVAIDYRETPDFVDAVRDVTAGGVDVCFDPVGGDAFAHSRRCMNWDGRLLVIGFTSGVIPDAPANHVLLKSYQIVGVHWGASVMRDPTSVGRQQAELRGLFEAGEIDPLMFEPYEFDDAPQALDDLANRRTWGKVAVVL